MSWVEEEFEAINVGDRRLNNRFFHIVESLGLAPGKTIPQAFKSWGEIKACYNFFSNDLVSKQKLLIPHVEKTIERIKHHPVILLPSDTTDLNYTSKETMVGKERLIRGNTGIWLHTTIAVTPDRLTLGITDVDFWHRKPKPIDATSRDKAPIEEKESYRWLQSYLSACEIARKAPETQVINITDREGDIIELFETAQEQAQLGPAAYFITRARHDRCCEDTTKKTQKKLKQRLTEEAPLGEIEFSIPPTEKRKGRMVKQQIKAITMTVKAESIYKKSKKANVNAIMAIEENPPEGEKALIWFFITNLPINSFNDACNVIKYYLCRWEVEIFINVLKSGCKIEERQLQTTDRMKALIITFMILSWRVMYTMMLGRVSAEMSTAEIFEESEWKSVYKIENSKRPLPKKPPKLGEFIKMVAKLGGYIDRRNGEPPGIKTMWKGMARMVDFAIAWEAFGR